MEYNFYQQNNENNENSNPGQETQNIFQNEPKPKKSHKKAKRFGSILISGVLFGAIAGSAFTGSSYLLKTKAGLDSSAKTMASLTTTNTKPSATNVAASNTSSNMSVQDIAANCMPSIVAITNIGITEVQTFWGQSMQQQSKSSGSGVIIGKTDKELLIVTNYHVVEGSNNLTVVFSYDEDSEEPTAVEAHVKGYDQSKDLAVIAIDASDLTKDMTSQLGIATIGSSKDLHLGEQVVAIGNALGYGQSVTSGYVSALNRRISTSSEDGSSKTDSNRYIQTDAAINPGNSGGALFNMRGELVGINSAKIAQQSVEGMGYAIPISDVYDLIQDLMNQTSRTKVIAEKNRGYLGITGSNVTSDVSEAYGFPEGVYVSKVTEGSAAEKAGIKKGNIITKFDGKTISDMKQLQQLLTYYKAGETVKMTIKVSDGSEYKEKEVSITLSSAKEAGITQKKNSTQVNPYDGGNGNNGSNGGADDFFGFGDFFH